MGNKVTRKQAENVLRDIMISYKIHDLDSPWNGSSPTLRDNEHEGLNPGSWSIDWEEGPDGWAYDYSMNNYPEPVYCEAILGCILGVHPA